MTSIMSAAQAYFTTLLVVGFALPLILCLRSIALWDARARGRPLPPGPRSLPVVGNLLNMPKSRPWIGFRDLCAKYGDVLCLRVLNKTVIVLGSPTAIMELLHMRSANTSDRHQTPSIALTGNDWSFGFMSYGQAWRRGRRAFWQHFHPTAAANFQPVQRTMAHQFLAKMLKTPEHLEKHVLYNFSKTILKIVYGIDVIDESNETLAVIKRGIEGGRQILVSGGFLVDHFPLLRHLPAFVPFQRRFSEWAVASESLRTEPFARYKHATEQNGVLQCVIGDIIARMTKDGTETVPDAEEVAMNVGGTIFEAGSDTSFSTLQSAFLAMSLYPEVQKKAQAELDAVVGPNRLPDFSDRESLVYVNAIIKELLRWMPVTPLGLSHSTVEDDEFRGYFIPAGTIVMANIWACMHDPEEYEDPEVFRPERFIRDGKLDPNVRDPSEFAFGFGRRICPGRYFADAGLFITIASVLHVFKITPPLDERGEEIKIEPRMWDGFLSFPEDCRCSVKPRSPHAETLIVSAEIDALA